jgi:4-hydroxybenzoate polyprenyltransferase
MLQSSEQRRTINVKEFFMLASVSPSMVARGVVREIILIWAFIRYDLSATMIPAMLFVFAAWHSHDGQTQSLVPVIIKGISYFLLYTLTFCISNQIVGIHEDVINKPSRPLVSGQVCLFGAWWRWVGAMIAFFIVGVWFGVAEWTILWQCTFVVYNFGHGARSFAFKNLAMSLGVVAQLAAAWQLVTPITPLAWTWILTPALLMLIYISLQDLRDVHGDRQMHRATFPIVFGMQRSRWFLAIAFGMLPLIIEHTLLAPLPSSAARWIIYGILTTLSLIICVRLLWYPSPTAHHRTYQLFTYWYCWLLAGAIILIP